MIIEVEADELAMDLPLIRSSWWWMCAANPSLPRATLKVR